MNRSTRMIAITLTMVVLLMALPLNAFAATTAKAITGDDYKANLKWNKYVLSQLATSEEALEYYTEDGQYYYQYRHQLYKTHAKLPDTAKLIYKDSDSDYEKAKKIFEYVRQNTRYRVAILGWNGTWDGTQNPAPSETYANQSAIPRVVTEKYDISEAYAEYASVLLRYAGIPSKLAIGKVDGSEYHMWTIAYVDGRWINMDATNGNVYSIDEKVPNITANDYSWFDISVEDLSKTHRILADTLNDKYTEELVIAGKSQIWNGATGGLESVRIVVLSSEVTSVEIALARKTTLESIVIPASVTKIDEDESFSKDYTNSKFTIYGEAGSYAEEYAAKHGIKFKTRIPANIKRLAASAGVTLW